MAAEEFHLFPLLPGELRDQIWDQAVRRTSFRGVQYFSIFPAFPEEQVPEEFGRHLIPRVKSPQWEIIGAPPPESSASPPSWNHNQSTYAIDGGFWTACKESRAAMYRRYRPERWSWLYELQRRQPEHMSFTIAGHEEYYDVPATFLVNSDSGHQYFTVMPAQDLIFFQGYSTVPELMWLPDYLPFSSRRYGFGGLSHIAIEYDPSWTIKELHEYQRSSDSGSKCDMDSYRWKTYHELVSAIRNFSNNHFHTTIWLVDHRLRRRTREITEPNQKSTKESEEIVFQGNDCKYYSVPSDWSRLWEYDPEIVNQEGFVSAWNFAYAVAEVAGWQEAFEQGINEVDVFDFRDLVWKEFDVLVREKDD